MRNLLLVAGVAGLLGLSAACGGEDHPDAASTRGGTGGKGTAIAGSKAAGGGEDGGAGPVDVDPLAPTVTITAPSAVEDPNEGEVLVELDVEVTCLAEQSPAPGSQPVNGTTVTLSLLDAEGGIVETKPGLLGAADDEYTNTFNIAALPAGVVGFQCTAEDSSKRKGSNEISTWLDKGPTITFQTPLDATFHPLAELLEVEFTVEAAPLTDDDNGAEVASVEFQMGGTTIDLAGAEVGPGSYHLEVNLTDPILFDPAPDGPLPLTVTATNQRTPTPATAIGEEQVSIDGGAPTIQITYPLDKAVVGGPVPLTFKVADTVSGVDLNSIVVSLNGVEHQYDASSDKWGFSNGVVVYEFDSRQVEGSKVQITLNVRASDGVGNASVVVSELLYIDNYPPLLDLDPGMMRTVTPKTGGPSANTCSLAFDPVGDLAVNDGDLVEVAAVFRTLVWEQTNSVQGIPVLHFSGTKPGTIRLHLMPADQGGLLVDTNMDGVCDDVADPESDDALEMDPIPRAGSPWYALLDANGQDESNVAPSTASLNCDLKTGSKPLDLCTDQASDMWFVIEHGSPEPAIYAPGVTAGKECTGVGWEFGSLVDTDGWVCFATRAQDRANNVGISRPLRLCVDDPDVAGTPACAISSSNPPSCTNECTAPAPWGPKGLVF